MLTLQPRSSFTFVGYNLNCFEVFKGNSFYAQTSWVKGTGEAGDLSGEFATQTQAG